MADIQIQLDSSVAGQTIGDLLELSQRLSTDLQESLNTMIDINSRTTSDYIKSFTQEFIEFFGSETEGALVVPGKVNEAAVKIAEITELIITEDVSGQE